MSLTTGTKLGRYEIRAKIGAGGMGEVYLAQDTKLDRKVALKILPAEVAADRNRMSRFVQEAKAASGLNHPNIITIHEVDQAESIQFIATEFIDGETLREHMNLKQVKIAEALDLGVQIASALSAAHAAGIIHRDIKPENIMLRRDGIVKVLDFGLAKLTERLSPDSMDAEAATKALVQTEPGVVMGTVAYMSPEQARGLAVDARTDIWSLGVVLYEMLAGHNPFAGETTSDSLAAILKTEPSPLSDDTPDELKLIVKTSLRKGQEDRYQEAKDLFNDLKQLQMRVLVTAEIQRTSAPHREGAQTLILKAVTAAEDNPPSAIRHTVGRQLERNELRAAFSRAKGGRGSLLCVTGEPGIGKTTLVEDFLAEVAAGEQVMIARGRCSERLAGTEAYLPLLEALENLSKDGQQAAMKQLAPTWYAQVAPLSGESKESAHLLAEVKAASQERMKRELAHFLQSVAQRRPLVLFFDDLHWADVSTIDLLSFLAGKFDALNVLIVTTYRPSDMLLAKHPFLQIKPDLQARGLCRELLLEFLSEAEIAEYLALKFPDNHFPAEFPKLIHAKTEGSPLFMADLVRYLSDRSVIAKTSGRWALEQTLPDIERELPESVRGMIERKIAQLSEEDRKLLTAASVQGSEFDSAVVAQVLNLDAHETEERLEKLERVFAFVRLTSEAAFPNRTLTLKYRFVHVLYQNALYASLRATRKAELNRAVAQALEGCYGERSASVANELALLWEAAREYARAAECFLQAARNAAQVNAHREAVQLGERGLEALLKLPEMPERDGRELGLQLTLGFSLQSVLGWAALEAGVAFKRARQLCAKMGDNPRLFAALGGVAIYHIVRAEYETAQALTEQMLQLAEQAQDSVQLVVASMLLSSIRYYQGDLVSAHQHGERALELDRREYHEAYLSVSNEDLGISARRTQSFCLWSLGYADRALALAHESNTLAQQASHPFSLSGSHFGTLAVLALLRDWQSSQKECEKVFALAEEYALGDILNYATANSALNLAYQDLTEASIARVKQAIGSLHAKGAILGMTGYLGMLSEVLWLANRCPEGFAAVAEALAWSEQSGERYWEAELWRIKGELLLKAAANNAQAEAEICYQKAIAIAQRQSAKLLELRAVMSLARLWRRQGKTAEARQMLTETYGWFTEGFDMMDLKDARALLEALS